MAVNAMLFQHSILPDADTMPENNHSFSHLEPPSAAAGRKSFEPTSSVPNSSLSYCSSISSFSETNKQSLPSTLQNGTTYTFHLPQTYNHSRRNIHVRNAQGQEILYAKMSEHNPLKPDIQFFSSSTTSAPIGSAKFRYSKTLQLKLGNGEEKGMHAISSDRNYSFYLPSSSGTCRKVLWKRTNIEGGSEHATGKGNRSLRYELSDEGTSEVLAVYDES
ncbi:uncharacterized protein PAC_10050 [Phialocephala subalpina]|uniref:Uncharacterized protein n=1 Tax=Phialocephala subalpina TaxID=576137 RepID=A0A1L7X553_9HELO|nr:uncharacterized protein PAC_10050 [Phialocephala subalpina]